jgi:type I restriction enzyme S subunit
MIEATENTKTAWLGEFPAHWEVLRIKNLFQEMDSRSETGSEELLSVSHYTGVTLKRESLENEDDHLTNAESLVGYKLVAKNDLVINIMLAWNGSLGISPNNGITSPAYCVYRIKGDNNPEYFGYLFTTNLFKAEFRRHSTGIIDSRLRLYSDKFFSIFTVLPPKDEQDKIVQYIKAQEEKINLFIQKKLRFIELLKEQKRNIYRERIINGLNKAVAKRTTKFEWLGEIPNHWELKRLKNVSENLNYRRIPIDAAERGRMAEQKFDYYGATGVIDKVENFIFDETTILVAEDGANLKMRNIKLVYIASGKYWVNNHAHIIRTSQMDIEYLAEWLELIDYNPLITGSAQPKLTKDAFMSVPVVVPPIEEQKQIVSHIKTETDTIDTAIAKTEKEIELIREYKEAMISEAVMGKRK